MITENIKKKKHYNVGNMARLGVKDSEEIKRKRRESQRKYYKENPKFGKDTANWKGGIKIDTKGYSLKLVSSHPYADKHGYVLLHRLVMEDFLKRYLLPNEIVHHVDGNVLNNDIGNLELFENLSKHIKHHWEGGDYANRRK